MELKHFTALRGILQGGLLTVPFVELKQRKPCWPAYPYLELEDILQAFKYAAWKVEEREVDVAYHLHDDIKIGIDRNLSLKEKVRVFP